MPARVDSELDCEITAIRIIEGGGLVTSHAHPFPQETRAGGTIDERDALTGVRGYYTLLRDFDYEEHTGEDVYVALCDLDNFRMLNDAYGENRCNVVLARVGEQLQRCFGDQRTYRYGSDEFLIVDAFESETAFLQKMETLGHSVDAIDIDGTPLHMTCSCGYARGRISDPEHLHEAIRLADRKMFEAKRLGKNRTVRALLEEDPTLTGTHHRDSSLKSYEIDELTGLANYIYFRRELSRLMANQRRIAAMAASTAPNNSEDDAQDERMALVYFNVENFKHYNQQFGFDAGDELLLLVSDAIQDAFPGKLASRFSADQFMVVTTEGSAEDGFNQVRNAFRARRKDTSIWLRGGGYVPEDDVDDAGLIMDRAKMACDSIKGRRDVFYRAYDAKLKAQIVMRRYVLDNFDRALAEGWIRPFYQPIARVATGDICDMEALSRWVDPERGIISPADFIPVLEDARLIHRLDLKIVRDVCADYRRIAQAGGHFAMPSVNLSRFDFELCDIVAEISAIADEYGVPHDQMAVEVTESALADTQEFLKRDIERFRERGFNVWMDDFGSDYSSLNLLKEYQFDLVKLDMAFLRNFVGNEASRIILSHIIGMAKELGFKTLVEGVETEEQYQFLRAIGCGRAQGWRFGKPDTLDHMLDAVAEGGGRSFEPYNMHDYYEDVGRINLMRPKPADPVDGHYATGDMPAVIVERRGGHYRFLNVSDTYRRFLESMALRTPEESEQLMESDLEHYVRLRQSIARAIESDEWDYTTYDDLIQDCTLLVKCIARQPEEDAYAVVVVNVDSRAMSRANAQDS